VIATRRFGRDRNHGFVEGLPANHGCAAEEIRERHLSTLLGRFGRPWSMAEKGQSRKPATVTPAFRSAPTAALRLKKKGAAFSWR
jgi:hypothetical protein